MCSLGSGDRSFDSWRDLKGEGGRGGAVRFRGKLGFLLALPEYICSASFWRWAGPNKAAGSWPASF
jgi:hypothetical protein